MATEVRAELLSNPATRPIRRCHQCDFRLRRVADVIVIGIELGKSHNAVDPLTKFLLMWEGLPDAFARPVPRRTIRRAQTSSADLAENETAYTRRQRTNLLEQQ
jgi:hypothetical protein